MLEGKNVLLGVTGSIAAYKIANLASMLVKQHCNVDVIMTENATNFIHPITFETLTGNKCIVDTFDRNFEYQVEHISLAKKADCVMIAPATANIIGKMANGIADDMLSTTVLACRCKVMVSPAMNTNMILNPIVKDNIEKLKRYGFEVIDADSGHLACGDTGLGKMPSEDVLLQHILRETAREKDMRGLKVCVTAGPTREAIDPIRFISNKSTGKMGYAVAKTAMLRGADVTLISGPVSIPDVPFVKKIDVVSAEDMYNAVLRETGDADILIKAAAVADYKPAVVKEQKMKKGDTELSLELSRTKDILGTVGANKTDRLYLCGFSMETENMIENAEEKLKRKNLDLIVANNVKTKGAGFGGDTNVVTLISAQDTISLPILSKEDVADQILDYILKQLHKR